MSDLIPPFYAASTNHRSRRRLVTQNLLASAARFERPGNPEPGTIDDLSSFIDLYCLYDKLVLMRDPSSEQLLDLGGSLFDQLKKDKTVVLEEVPSEASKVFLKDAEQRLRVFLKSEESDETEEWLAEFMDPANVKRQMEQWSLHPENKEHFAFGRKWLMKAPSYKDILAQLQDDHARRSAFFVARTFFYLSFANLTKYTFTPDVARSAVTEPVLTKEKLFIAELLKTLKDGYKPHGIFPELESMISPLSVIVFERAASKERIISEVVALREQLAGTREKIHILEDEAFNKGDKQSKKALQKWESTIGEIDGRLKGAGLMISRDQALDFGAAAMDLPSAKGALKLVKLPLEVISRMVSRGPVIEIHKLMPQLGSTDRVLKAINRLFRQRK